MLSDALACSVTHAGITPLNVAKCNIRQVNFAKYKGQTGVWKGSDPTLVRFSLQDMFEYGLYEVFEDAYTDMAGKGLTNRYKPAIWCAGSALAEVFTDIALYPLEMTKVKIQTSPNGMFPTAFGTAAARGART